MAYAGSTAATSAANPPRAMVMGNASSVASTLNAAAAAPGAQGGNLWYYCSTNTTAEVVAANFFTDGKALGMRPGDVLLGVFYTSVGTSAIPYVGAITSVTTDGASLCAVPIV